MSRKLKLHVTKPFLMKTGFALCSSENPSPLEQFSHRRRNPIPSHHTEAISMAIHKATVKRTISKTKHLLGKNQRTNERTAAENIRCYPFHHRHRQSHAMEAHGTGGISVLYSAWQAFSVAEVPGLLYLSSIPHHRHDIRIRQEFQG